MQRRPQQKLKAPLPLKRKGSPAKSHTPPKPHHKMPRKLLTAGKQSGSKGSIPRHSCSNSLFHSVGQLPLQNFEVKQRMLERALQGGNSSAHEESTRTRYHHHPNGEYFGTSHSILQHLEVSRHSKASSKHSKHSKRSEASKSKASLIAQKMKQYRQLQAKHSVEIQKIVGASPKEVRRLQKMHSLQRLQVMEELAKVERYA